MVVGTLALDLLLGDVHSLKEKRSVIRPPVAELRRCFEVTASDVLGRGRRRTTGWLT